MLADRLDYVIGVDTHRDQHMLAIVIADTGALVAQRPVPTNTRGYADAVRFADDYAPGPRLWAVEGAGHLRMNTVAIDRGRRNHCSPQPSGVIPEHSRYRSLPTIESVQAGWMVNTSITGSNASG
jgi:hypothetical protein